MQFLVIFEISPLFPDIFSYYLFASVFAHFFTSGHDSNIFLAVRLLGFIPKQ